MLPGYYDGSGKSNDSEFLTLTGVIASESVWERFDKSWRAILEKYQVSDFHTSEAMSLSGRFSGGNGWSRPKVFELMKDLWNVIGKYRWTDNFSLNSNLYGRSCTVIMQDYHRAKSANPKLREPEAICTRYCFNGLPVDLDSNLEHPEIFLVFDRGEPFLKTLYRNWIKGRNRPNAGWPKQIKGIEFGSASNLCPLQAADLIAWTMGKHHKTQPDGYPEALGANVMIAHHIMTYDYESLTKDFPNG
ncbi:MAG: DUF3800 domain-containing protein [Deltaproteobacteria bacterium]|nr:MAG: DUF3800 domain-containing protein [Deltaproteobacteria bacterium]